MQEDKKAYLVDLNLKVRVVVGDTIDPNIDEEFENALFENVKKRLKDEGPSFLTEGIHDFNEDLENPYDPEFDE